MQEFNVDPSLKNGVNQFLMLLSRKSKPKKLLRKMLICVDDVFPDAWVLFPNQSTGNSGKIRSGKIGLQKSKMAAE